MSVLTSTGHRTAVMLGAAFADMYRGGIIEIYSGLQPASADLAPTGAHLGRITRDGGAWVAGVLTNGLEFANVGAYDTKDPGHVWQLKGSGTGVAGWFRLLPNAADAGADSLSALRVDGSIGLDVGEMILPSTSITPSTAIGLTSWWYALPPL